MPLRLLFTIRTESVDRAHRRQPVVTRAVAVLVSLALCAALGGLTAGPAAAAARAAAECTDVRLVLANGSGARPITQPEKRLQMMSDAVHTAIQPQRTVGTYTLPYPAESTDTIGQGLGGILTFLGSIDTGMNMLFSHLAGQVGNCPKQHFLLGGYSQGAIVIHLALQKLENTTRSSLASASTRAQAKAVLERIDGVALIADGARVPGRKPTWGNAESSATGIVKTAAAAAAWKLPVPTSLPSRFSGRSVDVCDFGDVVCNFDVVVNCLVAGCDVQTQFNNAKVIHGLGYEKEASLAGTRLASFARGYPLVRTTSYDVSGRVGVPLNIAPVEVVVDPGTSLAWSVSRTVPGLRFSKGRFVGTPTKAGVHLVTVRIVSSGGYTASTATVRFTIAARAS